MGFLACVWDVVGQIVVSVFDLLPSSTCSDVRLGGNILLECSVPAWNLQYWFYIGVVSVIDMVCPGSGRWY